MKTTQTSRIVRAFAIAVLGASMAGAALAQTAITTVRVASGLSQPLFATAPRGDLNRVFIVQQGGLIRILKMSTGAINATPFLNAAGVITSGGERGLLGLAFHPDYSNNGRFFIYYTRAADGALTVAEYSVSANPDVANPAATRIVITVPHSTNSNHNGGCTRFGPDGFLYFGTGDGGGAGDSPCNAQNKGILLGKLVRIDVDSAVPYAIPPSNPFFGDPNARQEIWAFGLRNPWRWCFDSATGDMYIGDVGQNAVEEIDFQPASSAGGENYGWKIMEGDTCFSTSACNAPPPCNSPLFTDPIHTYTHSSGNCSVTGGCVYRGCAVPGLAGTYFFADYCSNQIWSFKYSGGAVTQFTNRTAQLAPGGGLSISNITSFGEDGLGEIYICDQGGELFKIVPATPVDCNGDNLADSCDIALGQSTDIDGNGVPDECQGCAVMSNYCTAGTSTHGCVPSIAGIGTPSASAGSGFTIRTTNVEGQTTGLIFYGLSGAFATPWAPMSSSFFCLVTPTQRTPIQGSGGTAGACNGMIQIDWNAYIASTPGALGTPFSAGDQVWTQLYYRDLPAPRATNLSNGLTFLVCP